MAEKDWFGFAEKIIFSSPSFCTPKAQRLRSFFWRTDREVLAILILFPGRKNNEVRILIRRVRLARAGRDAHKTIWGIKKETPTIPLFFLEP